MSARALGGPDADGRMFVKGAVEAEVHSIGHALHVLAAGHARRRIAATVLNRTSSRSHAVFSIKVGGTACGAGVTCAAGAGTVGCPWRESAARQALSAAREPGAASTQPRIGANELQFALVDLAGSERTARTQNSGDRLKETGSINKSLMTLCHCIEVWRRGVVWSA